MKRLILTVILNLTLCSSVFAETSLWKAQMGASVIYLGGTCHVLRASDYPLPEEFTKAYEDSATIVFETDLDKMNSPEIQQMLISKAVYGENTSLEKVLSPHTYQILKQYCEASGIPLAPLKRFKPPIVVVTLVTLELKKLGVNVAGVDKNFFDKAKADGKKIEGLESVQEQMDFILSMGKGDEDHLIEHTLKDIKKTAETMNELIAAWKEGNESKLNDLFVAQLKKDCPSLYKSLLVERNRAWQPTIERFLQTPGKKLVLVGVAHLIGKDGILEQLKKRGYKVSRF